MSKSNDLNDGSSHMAPKQIVSTVFAAWFLSLAFDLFLHAGLLAQLYVQPSPFLLDAASAFRRIPLGYGAFLVLSASLYWVLDRLKIRSTGGGFRYGAAAGAVVWGALVLGLYSISTISWILGAGWWLGQTLELGLSGSVIGAARQGVRQRRLWAIVVLITVVCVVVTIILQSTGWAPAMQMES